MVFNLGVAKIKILLCFFFLFPVVRFYTKIENARLKRSLSITTGAPVTVANDAIEMLPVLTGKTINDLSK